MDLSGKVAIVTGGGRGLGLAYATELARDGAAVVITGWSADAIAGVWPGAFAPALQTVGQQLPEEAS